MAWPTNMSEMITVLATKWNKGQRWPCKPAPQNAAAPLVAWSIAFCHSYICFLTISAKYIRYRLIWLNHFDSILIIKTCIEYDNLRRWSHHYRLLLIKGLLIVYLLSLLNLLLILNRLLILIWLGLLHWLLILNWLGLLNR